MPDVDIVNFEDEDGVDEAGAMREACSNLAKLEYDPNDLKFFFKQAEIKMSAVGVKKNYTKFQILTNILPKRVIDEVKSLVCKDATDFPNRDAYKQLKAEILRIFGPRPEAGMERALSRVLTGLPSQLARALVNDICSTELACKDCPPIVLALWKRHLPGPVRASISSMQFNKTTFNAVLQHADDVFISNAPQAAVAAVSLNETQPAIPYPVPEVAAATRGGWRGGRGGRGGNRGNRGGASSASSNNSNNSNRATKHPDLPSGDVSSFCKMHFRWGKSAHFCAMPASCPWKDIFTPKPAKK